MASREKIIGLTPEYLTENNLWDGVWLEEKYPHYFVNKQ